MVVAVSVGRPGIDTLLVISQVVLSIVLPFVMFPLIWLTSSSVVMRVPRPREFAPQGEDDIPTLKAKEDESADDEKRGESSTKEKNGVEFTIEEVVPDSTTAESGDGEDILEFPENEEMSEISSSSEKKGKSRAVDVSYVETAATPLSVGDENSEYVDFSNSWPLTILSYAVWLVILVANGYLIVTFAID